MRKGLFWMRLADPAVNGSGSASTPSLQDAFVADLVVSFPRQLRTAPCLTLKKDNRTARCTLIPYGHGLELRLDVDGEMRTTPVCRGQDEWLKLHAEWKQKLLENGWRHRQFDPKMGLDS
jgi:hypothetical protein